MKSNGWVRAVGFATAVLVAATGCTTGTDVVEEAAASTVVPARSVEERCQQGAEQIVDRLQLFIASFGDITPQEFLGRDELDGLGEFQDDVAVIIAETANQSSTLCNLDGLQAFLDAELQHVESDTLLATYLVSSIRDGGVRETANVALGPDDDVEAVLALLDDGSTVTLGAGTYRFESALLFQNDIAIVGDGVDQTIISSSSSDAAMAVFGQGKLTMRDLSVEHVGDNAASVVLAFGAAIDLERVRISGASIGQGSGEDAGGGNGVLLSTGTVDENGLTQEPAASDPEVVESRIVDSELSANAIAGITVIGKLSPYIASNRIIDNTLCGLCYLGEAAGTAENNVVSGNEFGIQIGDQAAPVVVVNTVAENQVAGMVVLGDAQPQVQQNQVANNGEVGVAIQGSAQPVVSNNEVTGHTFGFTIVGSATPQMTTNMVAGAEVAMQVAEDARPSVIGTTVSSDEGIGFVLRDNASGTYDDIEISGAPAVGFLVEGASAPSIRRLSVVDSEVGISYRETAAGDLQESSFVGMAIGVQAEDQAAPEIVQNDIIRAGAAGLVLRTVGPIIVQRNTISDAETLGIGLAGDSQATVTGNTIEGGETAISFVDAAAGEVRDNVMVGQVVAVQVGDSAAPHLERNRIDDAQGAAIVYRDDASGIAVDNSIVNPVSVGIQVVDAATPELGRNAVVTNLSLALPAGPNGSISGVDVDADLGSGDDAQNDVETADEADPDSTAGSPVDVESTGSSTAAEDATDEPASTVGILFAGNAEGQARSNQVLGFVIGVQISDQAAPEITENVVDGGALGGVGVLYRDDAAGRAADNRTSGHSIGFQVSDRAAPTLQGNAVEQVGDVAFLFQGFAAGSVADNACPGSVPGIGLLEDAAPELGTNFCQVVTGSG